MVYKQHANFYISIIVIAKTKICCLKLKLNKYETKDSSMIFINNKHCIFLGEVFDYISRPHHQTELFPNILNFRIKLPWYISFNHGHIRFHTIFLRSHGLPSNLLPVTFLSVDTLNIDHIFRHACSAHLGLFFNVLLYPFNQFLEFIVYIVFFYSSMWVLIQKSQIFLRIRLQIL